MVDTHISQVVFADESKSTNVHSKIHPVLSATASDRKLLQLSHNLVHEMFQLPFAAHISTLTTIYTDFINSILLSFLP